MRALESHGVVWMATYASHLQHITASRPLGADTFCAGQLDQQVIRLDLDSGKVVLMMTASSISAG
jgi:hypothetical protein